MGGEMNSQHEENPHIGSSFDDFLSKVKLEPVRVFKVPMNNFDFRLLQNSLLLLQHRLNLHPIFCS